MLCWTSLSTLRQLHNSKVHLLGGQRVSLALCRLNLDNSRNGVIVITKRLKRTSSARKSSKNNPTATGTKHKNNETSTNKVSFVSSPLLWYSTKLETHPLTTKCVSSGIIAASGDGLCQYLVQEQNMEFQMDWIRTCRFGVLGLGLVAPVVHVWYRSLWMRFPETTLKAVVQRTFFDQAFFAPLFIPTFMLNLAMLQGRAPQETLEKIQRDLPPTLVTNWCLWIPAQMVNFRFVPLKYQVLFSNMVGFVWNAYLSWRTQEEHD